MAVSPELLMEALLDIESQPVWARAVKKVTVLERDANGRPDRVAFEVGALGYRLSYTLRYDYSALPDGYTWQLVDGDALALDGGYSFEPCGTGQTRVTYHLRVDLRVPIPRVLMRQAERLVLATALRDLKAYVEP